jgi:two-component system chemotaxis response regulator CheB
LTGTLSDGSAGLAAVRKAGGVAVVQDPDDAAYSAMPQSALDAAGADHCVPLKDMARLLARLSSQTVDQDAGKMLNPATQPEGLGRQGTLARRSPSALLGEGSPTRK